jgi:hypothetical protein
VGFTEVEASITVQNRRTSGGSMADKPIGRRMGQVLGVEGIRGMVSIVVALIGAGAIGTFVAPRSGDSAEPPPPAAPSVPLDVIQAALGEFWSGPDSVPASLARLVDSQRELQRYQANFSFKLFLLEMRMGELGGPMMLNREDVSRQREYQLIQDVLADIGRYEGPIDGDRLRTHDALISFQHAFNVRWDPTSTQPCEVPRELRPVWLLCPLGAFGYKTLEAIRTAHRERSSNP